MRNFREDLRVPDAKADLYLVGLGIGSFERRTVEVHEILADCSSILHLTAFDAQMRATYTSEVVNLIDIYESADEPQRVYSLMSDLIFEYVWNNRFLGSVAFVTYGHPLFLVDTSWDLIRRGGEAGVSVKPVAATSYVDQVLCDLGKRFDRGVQQYLAEDFSRYSITIDNRFPLLLAQVGDYGSDTLRPSGNLLSRLTPLFVQLRRSYPADRLCHLVMSSWRDDMAPEIKIASLSEIETLVSSVHVGCSMYIEGLFD